MPTKWAGDDGSPRKTIYHSYLAREGRMMVKFKGDPRESKYKGKPDYVYIQVPDDDAEYALNLEPGTEDAVRNAPKDQWVFVHAIGATKDEPKALRIEDGAGPVFDAEDYTPPAGIPADAPPPPPMWPDDEPKGNGKPNGYAGDQLMRRCWQDAVSLVRADFADASPDAAVEAASRVANTIYIQASRG